MHLLTHQGPDVQPGQLCHCSILPVHLISLLHPEAGEHLGLRLVQEWDRARIYLVRQLRHGLICLGEQKSGVIHTVLEDKHHC